jgi:SAM-dependent methyltransferase
LHHGKSSYDVEEKIERHHWWFIVRRNLLRTFLSSLDLPPKSLTIDIGCGVGSNLKVLESFGYNVIGIDQSLYALGFASKKVRISLLNADSSKLPIHPNSVGLIIAMDVLEHLKNDTIGIEEFFMALKEGGILILTVPAFPFLWGTQDVFTGHKRRYSLEEIQNKLREKGFELLRASYFNFFLFFPILLARRLIHLLGLKVESENEINSPITNFFLKRIFSLETHLLQHFSFPFGVSIFCIAKKMAS